MGEILFRLSASRDLTSLGTRLLDCSFYLCIHGYNQAWSHASNYEFTGIYEK